MRATCNIKGFEFFQQHCRSGHSLHLRSDRCGPPPSIYLGGVGRWLSWLRSSGVDAHIRSRSPAVCEPFCQVRAFQVSVVCAQRQCARRECDALAPAVSQNRSAVFTGQTVVRKVNLRASARERLAMTLAPSLAVLAEFRKLAAGVASNLGVARHFAFEGRAVCAVRASDRYPSCRTLVHDDRRIFDSTKGIHLFSRALIPHPAPGDLNLNM